MSVSSKLKLFPSHWWLSLQPSEGSRYLFHLQSLTGVMLRTVRPQLHTADPLATFCATSIRPFRIVSIWFNYSTRFQQPCWRLAHWQHCTQLLSLKPSAARLTTTGLFIHNATPCPSAPWEPGHWITKSAYGTLLTPFTAIRPGSREQSPQCPVVLRAATSHRLEEGKR